MVKSDDQVISQFNSMVNMSTTELEKWLQSDESTSAGQQGDSDESKGHESGRQIVDILKRNPSKAENKYTEEDLQHMRRVVAYVARHSAQEDRLKESKTKEELEETKSTRSLRSEFSQLATLCFLGSGEIDGGSTSRLGT